MNIDKLMIVKEIENHEKSPKTVLEWMEFFNVEDQDRKDFIILLDELVKTYEVIMKNDFLYLGKWDNYFHGRVRVNRRGFGFIDLEDRESIYISKDNLKNVYDKDIVVAQVINDKDEGHIVEVLERNLEKIVGTVYSKRLPVKFIADNLMYENKIEIMNMKDYPNLNRHKVLLRVISFNNNKIQANVEKVLGYMDDPGVDILAVLLENNIRLEWPEAVLEQLKTVPDSVSEADKVNRVDLTDQLIFSIDGDDAKDLDDAISIKQLKNGNYLLGVHIMDVDYYVEKGSAIDKEAYARGTSVYVADRVVSMLPPQLSNGICSLNPDVERLAMSISMEINKNGNVVNYDIAESVIVNKHRLTYRKVNDVFNNPKAHKEYKPVKESLREMRDLATILQARRDKLGAIDFDKDEIDLKINKQGEIESVGIRERGEAERLIENFMVITNETIARLMAYSEWPSIYRIHEKPDPAKMRDFANLASIMGYQMKGSLDAVHPAQLQTLLSESKDDENYFVLANQMLRSMQKARYDVNNIGHFGLASKEYGHFTSPIRRYPDLILHRMLKKYFIQNEFNTFEQDEKYLVQASLDLSNRERQAITAEREVNDMKIAEYMEKHIGDVYKGSISSVHNFGIFVQLDNMIEGLIKIDTLKGFYNLSPDGYSLLSENNKTYKMGDKVTVRLITASKALRNVDFEIFEPENAKSQKRRPAVKKPSNGRANPERKKPAAKNFKRNNKSAAKVRKGGRNK